MTGMMTRAQFLRLGAVSAAMAFAARDAWAQEPALTRDLIYNDPDAPSAGNPQGDVTIVDFFDYNCPYCKAAAPGLESVVKNDGNVRLVYRDWPVLAETSMPGARMALAARYQDKYLMAHHALMNIPGYGIAQEKMTAALRTAGVDMDRLDADMKDHAADISRLINRNLAIADAIGLQGTPGFLIGPYKVNQALNEAGFKHAIADARARQKTTGR